VEAGLTDRESATLAALAWQEDYCYPEQSLAPTPVIVEWLPERVGIPPSTTAIAPLMAIGFDDPIASREPRREPPRRSLLSELSRPVKARYGAAAAVVGALAVFGAYQFGRQLGSLLPMPAPPMLTDAEHAPNRPAPAPGPDASSARVPPYQADALKGDPAAEYNLAVLYSRGDEGLPLDWALAASWFRKSADAGNPPAQFNLGVLYQKGLGVERDASEAVKWYRSAAESGYAAAEYNLGVALADGQGAAQNANAAARWYRAAALQGLTPAMVNLAILYEQGNGVGFSLPDAYAWYRAAARRGDTAAETRAHELFERFAGPAKAQAVIAAARTVDALGETGSPAPAAGGKGDAALMPGTWFGQVPGTETDAKPEAKARHASLGSR
jgi:TPR repeat protein